MDAELTDTFNPTVDEIQALKRLELETIAVVTAIADHVPQRLVDQGFIALNSEDRLTLTPKGLALVRRY